MVLLSFFIFYYLIKFCKCFVCSAPDWLKYHCHNIFVFWADMLPFNITSCFPVFTFFLKFRKSKYALLPSIFPFWHSLSVSYSIVLQDLLKVVSLGWEGYGDSWHAKRENLLMIYGAALASNCRRLIQMLQVIFFSFLIISDW